MLSLVVLDSFGTTIVKGMKIIIAPIKDSFATGKHPISMGLKLALISAPVKPLFLEGISL